MKISLTEEFIQKLKAHNSTLSFTDNRNHLTRYLFRTMVGYRLFNAFFIFCLTLAVCSSGVSLYYLWMAALAPTHSISSTLLTMLTVEFLVINPFFYIAFHRASESFISIIRSRLTIKAEHIPMIKDSIEISKSRDAYYEILYKNKINLWGSKKRKFATLVKFYIDAVIHPIRFLNRIRNRRAVDRLRRELLERDSTDDSTKP